MNIPPEVQAAVWGVILIFIGAVGKEGVPLFWNWAKAKVEAAKQREHDTITLDNNAEKIEQQKDLALIRSHQVLEDEVKELRSVKHAQSIQILEQAAEISRLKNYESALEEVRHQRRLLLEWIETEFGAAVNKDILIKQLRNEVLILESMLYTDPTNKDKG